jgi:hypothetical protein
MRRPGGRRGVQEEANDHGGRGSAKPPKVRDLPLSLPPDIPGLLMDQLLLLFSS